MWKLKSLYSAILWSQPKVKKSNFYLSIELLLSSHGLAGLIAKWYADFTVKTPVLFAFHTGESLLFKVDKGTCWIWETVVASNTSCIKGKFQEPRSISMSLATHWTSWACGRFYNSGTPQSSFQMSTEWPLPNFHRSPFLANHEQPIYFAK